DMVNWASDHGIVLVSVEEVFSAGSPMRLQEFYKTEWNKQTEGGWGAASDILRLEILYRFGGVYSDVDNVFRSGLVAELEEIAGSLQGWGLGGMAGVPHSDVIAAPAGHPAIGLWLEMIRANYLVPQADLYGGERGMTGTAKWAGSLSGLAHRISQVFR